MTAQKLTDAQIEAVIEEAFAAAAQATANYLAKYGECACCGFAWVNVTPGTSKVAKILKAKYNARKPYGGTGVQIWNPGKSYTQSITAKEEGAYAFASIIKDKLGVDAYAGSRMD